MKNTTSKIIRLLGLSILLATGVAFSAEAVKVPLAEGKPLPKAAETEQAALVPVLRMDTESDMVIEFMFENRSSKPIRYLATQDGKRVLHFWLTLRKDGKTIAKESIKAAPIRSEQVKELAPGKGVPNSWNLKNSYGPLGTGRYEIILSYDSGRSFHLEKEYGITPLHFEQRMYLEIESKPK